MRWWKVLSLSGALAVASVPVLAQQPKGGAAPPKATASAKASAAPVASSAPAPVAPPPASASAPAPKGSAPAPAPLASGAPAGSGGPVAAVPMDGATYAVRLRDLEERIDQLKEQIRRSHTRLSLLSDTILSGGSAGARSNVKFTNELSGAFKITRLLIVLDGAVQYNKTDASGAISDQSEIPVFNGSIPPGDHTLQVLLNLQGSGYGVFSYLRGYRFEVRSSHSFTAVDGKTIQLQAIAYEKGGLTTPLEERPAVRYVEKTVTGLVDGGGAAAPAASK